jgi:hypothetical protein
VANKIIKEREKATGNHKILKLMLLTKEHRKLDLSNIFKHLFIESGA